MEKLLPFAASLGLIQTPVYKTVHDILTHTLIHLRGVEKNLKYWQSLYDKASCPEFLRTVTRLSKLRCSLCTFLSKVYAENFKFSDPAYYGCDKSRLLVLYILGIQNHFLELEESIHDKTTYPAPSELGMLLLLEKSVRDNLQTEFLSFKKLGDENEDLLLLRWSADNFKDAVDLLSSNFKKLEDYVSFMPSKLSRRWKYYTFGAIGVSVFSLWLLRHGRLSRVVPKAKKSVAGLLIDPIKQMESVNRRYEEMMELKQVQSTRDFRFKKELTILSGEDPARPTLNQIERLKLGVEMAKEFPELSNEVLMGYQKISATMAAIPAFFISVGGVILSCAVVKRVLLGQERTARAEIRLLVKEVEERFIESQKQCSPSDRHYNHGLMLCALDRLYRAVERHEDRAEFSCSRNELIALGKLTFADSSQRVVISHFKKKYAAW